MGGIVSVRYASTLISAAQALTSGGYAYSYLNYDGAEIVAARNFLANRFLADREATDLLFIDGDMAIAAETISRLLAHPAGVVGAIYTERRFDRAVYAERLAAGEPEPRAMAAASTYAVGVKGPEVAVRDGFCRVAHIGFGCVVVRRAVFEALIDRGVAEPIETETLRRAGLTGPIYDFFGRLPNARGDYLSEDYSFCRRVERLGEVEIWGEARGAHGHVGAFAYAAPFVEWLKNRASTP